MNKKTKIIATIGLASNTSERLEQLFQAGVNVCRLNFSFGTHDEHLNTIALIREVAQRMKLPVAILLDLQGPKIRIGKLSEPVKVESGDIIILSGKDHHHERLTLPTTYKGIARDCIPGKIILIADGKIILKVKSACKVHDEVKCQVLSGGEILTGKGINLPYTSISLPAITAKDIQDAEFGIRAGVDFIGMSFVRSAKDIAVLKNILQLHESRIPIIAKIEKPEALDNIDAILDEVDGIMVARGDLAVELSFQKVPVAQKALLHKANCKCKFTITATEMLSSMINNPMPTRADVSDVANAVWDGTDAVMLSNETAVGGYPVEAVSAMNDIVLEIENAKNVFRHDLGSFDIQDSPIAIRQSESICKAISGLSHDNEQRRIAVVVTTGETVKILSKYRPRCRIYAFTSNEKLYNKMALFHNTYPILVPKDLEALDEDFIIATLIEQKLLMHENELICLHGIRDAVDDKIWSRRTMSILTV